MAKILVVDDDPDFLQMIRLLLEQRGGHQTILCAEGEEGLARAIAEPPDLVILDVMMPGITGYEICRKLRATPVTAGVPVIILTARGQPVDRQAALDAGADDFMAKPVTMADLLDRINALLERGHRTPVFSGTIALLSLRGGVGVTTLAVNLAATLTQSSRASSCLVDLCPSSGHVALQLGMRPDPNWLGLVQTTNPAPTMIEKHLLRHSSGLHILASPPFPVVRQRIPHVAAQRMLAAIQQQFASVIIDTPSALDEHTLVALEMASVVCLVVTAEPPSIQTTVGTLRALQQWAPKCYIILNQVVPGPQPPAEALARTLKRPVVGAVPFDPAQARALAQGTPLAFQTPPSPLAQAVQEIARGIAGLKIPKQAA